VNRFLLALLILLGGCRATLPNPASLAERPDDFVLSATVFTASPPEPGTPRARRPARYIVEADETLRTATGQGSGRDTFPPPTRTLTAGQMERLWVIVRESGLLEPGNRYLLASPARGASDPVAAAIDIAYRGGRAHLLIPLDGADAESIAAERLVDELAALSWIE
jgi:hypothetical protein